MINTKQITIPLLFLLCTGTATAQSTSSDLENYFIRGQYDQLIAESSDTDSNPQRLFLRARAFNASGDLQSAKSTYQILIQRFPTLPEPYNNLALIEAQQGNLNQAINTLNSALQNHPGFAVTYNNLLQIYQDMASRAYQKALKQETKPDPLKLVAADALIIPSLQLDDEIVTTTIASNQNTRPSASSSTSAAVSADTAVEDTVAVASVDINNVDDNAGETLLAAQADSAETTPQSTNDVLNDPATVAAVNSALQGWASAWSDRNVDAYLSFYSNAFKPTKGTYKEWRDGRYGRLRWREYIKLELENISIKASNDEATVNFIQYYESDVYQDVTNKQLIFKKSDNRWLIVAERSLG